MYFEGECILPQKSRKQFSIRKNSPLEINETGSARGKFSADIAGGSAGALFAEDLSS